MVRVAIRMPTFDQFLLHLSNHNTMICDLNNLSTAVCSLPTPVYTVVVLVGMLEWTFVAQSPTPRVTIELSVGIAARH